MPRFQVTFKGPNYDLTVTGDSAEKVVEEYIAQRKNSKRLSNRGRQKQNDFLKLLRAEEESTLAHNPLDSLNYLSQPQWQKDLWTRERS